MTMRVKQILKRVQLESKKKIRANQEFSQIIKLQFGKNAIRYNAL